MQNFLIFDFNDQSYGIIIQSAEILAELNIESVDYIVKTRIFPLVLTPSNADEGSSIPCSLNME